MIGIQMGSGGPPQNDAQLLADRNKLLHLISHLARSQSWLRKKTYSYYNRLTYLFNYQKEELSFTFHPHAVELFLRPQDAPLVLRKIAEVFKTFYQQNPQSQMRMIVTVISMIPSRVKTSLETMQSAGIDIEKIAQFKNRSGEIFPPETLQQLIREVKSKQKPYGSPGP
ncbi:MAG: hypothetical protein AB7I18_08660 [Candidatus Berkiella sp.]